MCTYVYVAFIPSEFAQYKSSYLLLLLSEDNSKKKRPVRCPFLNAYAVAVLTSWCLWLHVYACESVANENRSLTKERRDQNVLRTSAVVAAFLRQGNPYFATVNVRIR